jgi:assimilatory nitrate reductase catalytic subunit
MGFADAFAYRTVADVFREHAALSAFENDGARDFDLGGLAQVSDAEFDALEPVQWPFRNVSRHPEVPAEGGPRRMVADTGRRPSRLASLTPQDDGEKRFFASGGFFTPDRRARFVAPERPALKEPTTAEFPLRLNTGRIRDQWHTMTRTGKSARLGAHLPEPFVEMHPRDADAAGLRDGALARIATAHGACVVRVTVTEDQRPGSVFVPIHWSGETYASQPVGDLVAPHTDPYSGQPEAKATPAAICAVDLAMRGLVRTRRPLVMPAGTWWTRVATADGVDYLVASNSGPLIWHDFAHRAFGGEARLSERVDAGGYCAVAFLDGEVEGYLSIGRGDVAAQWSAVKSLLAAGAPGADAIPIAPTTGDRWAEIEPVVCACFGVGLTAIRDAMAAGAGNVADIGRVLGAGTNCGSCLPELKRIVARERLAKAV